MLKKIRTHDQLHKIFDAMVAELVQANFHFKLLTDLGKAQREYWREFSQSQAFWSLTMGANQDAVIFRLCKAYSQDRDSANLRTFLETVRANRHFFDADRFRERLRANPHVDSLAASPRHPDPKQLERDLATVRRSEPRVNNLMMWRDKYYAHRDPGKVLNAVVLSRDYPITFTDVRWLLENALRIMDHYGYLYLATVNCREILGQDDYMNVLKALREQVRAYDARVRRDVKIIQRHEAADRRRQAVASTTPAVAGHAPTTKRSRMPRRRDLGPGPSGTV